VLDREREGLEQLAGRTPRTGTISITTKAQAGTSRINLSKKTTGILHELEKAHIYIEQLNSSAKSQQALIEQLNSTVKSQQALIEEFTHRLEALEHK
jgi:peptidoglycan hydrolase CwlO-like protein